MIELGTIRLFKDDVWKGIWQHTKGMFLPVIMVGIVYVLVSMGISYAVFSAVFGKKIMEPFYPGSSPDIESVMDSSEELFLWFNDPQGGAFLAFVGAFLLMLLIASWFLNMLLTMSQMQLEEGRSDIGKAFTVAFGGKTFRIFLYFIMATVMYVISFVATMRITSGLPLLIFPLSIIFWIFWLRFIAVPAAIVHGNMKVSDAIQFSWDNVTFRSAFKIFITIIVLSIAIILLVKLISSASSNMGASARPVFDFVFMLGLMITMYAFMTAGLSASYYHYVDAEVEQSETDHLIEDLN